MKLTLPSLTKWIGIFSGYALFFGGVFLPGKAQAQTNIAPAATVSGSDCRTSVNCEAFNDQNYSTCGTQLVWISTSNPPSSVVGTDWIEWQWPNAESFDEIVFHHANATGRFLTGGLIQYWDGTSWQNHYTYSNLPMQCVNSLTIPRLTTNRMRITSFQMTGSGQTSNPNFREIEIFSAPTSPNDAGVAALVSPVAFCPGTEDIIVRVQNFGVNQINTVQVGWSVNGVPQTGTTVTQTLDTIGGLGSHFADITLGSWVFAPNTSYTIEAWTFLPNNTADTTNFNDTLTRTIAAAIAGTFTINSFAATGGTNFSSFTEFATFLNVNGICGPVIANVAAGTGPYNEQVEFEDIVGADTVNTITINGNGNSLVYSATATGDRTTLTLSGTKWMTINDLIIEANGASFAWAVHLTNGTSNNGFYNCSFLSSTTLTSANAAGLVASGAATSATTYGNAASFTTIENCFFEGGYYSIAMNGLSANNNSPGNRIINCELLDWSYYGIYASAQADMEIIGNDISRPGRTNGTIIYALTARNGMPNGKIMNNRIHDTHNGQPTSTSTIYVMDFRTNTTSMNFNDPLVVANNQIYNIQGGGLLYAVYSSNNSFVKWLHNTINIDEPNAPGSGNTRLFYVTSNANSCEFKNNIMYLNRGNGGAQHLVYINTATTLVEIDNNAYWADDISNSNVAFGYHSTDHSTFADWQMANNLAYDQNGTFFNPTFIGGMGTDFLRPGAGAINGLGTNMLTYVPLDYDSVARSASPDPGAYEFTPLPCTGAGDLTLDSVWPGGALVSWSSLSSEWQVEWGTCGFIPGSNMGTLDSVVTVNNNYSVVNPPMGVCICLFVREKCPQGGYGPWSLPLEICVPIEDDAELVSLVTPEDMGCGDSLMPVMVEIRNNGFNPITNLPITVDISGDINQTFTFTYTGNLLETQVDTVTVGTINSYWGGFINVVASVSLPNDQLTSNDTVSHDSLVILPYQPLIFDTYACPNEPNVTFNALHIPNIMYNWYDVPMGGVPIFTGDSVTVPNIGNPTFYVGYNDINDSLQSTATGNTSTGNGGNMFDLDIFNAVTLTGFSVMGTSTTVSDIDVYYRVGSLQGHQTNPASWIFVETVPNVQLLGSATYAKFNLANPIPVSAGQVYGIYLQPVTGSFSYASGDPLGSSLGANADMEILTGNTKAGSWTSNLSPRSWKGRVHYGSQACSGVRTPVSAIVPPDSIVAEFEYNQISHTVTFFNTSINADSVVWFFDTLAVASGDTVSYQFPRTDSFEVCLIAYGACENDTVCKWIWAENISVAEHSLAGSLSVYPNPNEGRFTLSFNQQQSSDVTIQLLDLSGKTVWTEHHKGFTGVYQKDFDRNDLSSGMYMLRINNREGIITRRVVIGK